MALLSQKIDYEPTRQQPLSFRKAGPFIIFFLCLLVSQVSSGIIGRNNFGSTIGNSGTAFGLPINSIIGYALVFSIAIGFFFVISLRFNYLATPVAIILAGGLSNGLDRLFLGFVRDPIRIVTWYGNIADILIGVGIFWVIWAYAKK